MTNTSNTERKWVESISWLTGTVQYFDFEGGFYGIVTAENKQLLPMNLSKEFKIHGTTIKFQGKIIKDMLTTKQWGEPFHISSIKLIKLGHGAVISPCDR